MIASRLNSLLHVFFLQWLFSGAWSCHDSSTRIQYRNPDQYDALQDRVRRVCGMAQGTPGGQLVTVWHHHPGLGGHSAGHCWSFSHHNVFIAAGSLKSMITVSST